MRFISKKLAVLVLLCGVVAFVAAWYWPTTYQHRSANELVGFPLCHQPDDISCGPTSTFMVLQFYQKMTNLAKVKETTKTEWFHYKDKEFGTTIPGCIVETLRLFGISASLSQGNLDQLKYYVDQGRPPIVLVRTGKYLWHYVVIIGYSSSTVIVADPGYGTRAEWSNQNFLGAWEFLTDTEGSSVAYLCPLCRGTGYWSGKLGPLARCDVCGGTGYISDVLAALLRTAEVYPRTMIVPRYSSNSPPKADNSVVEWFFRG